MLPEGISFGVGTWAWGDRLLWEYGRDYGRNDLTAVFRRYLNDGISFFCTSPVFAEGISESILGELAAETNGHLVSYCSQSISYWLTYRAPEGRQTTGRVIALVRIGPP